MCSRSKARVKHIQAIKDNFMPMKTTYWRGLEFRIATDFFSKNILNWNLPMPSKFNKLRKEDLAESFITAMDAYVKNNGFAGLDVKHYLDKMFVAGYSITRRTP
jgi:hypothetical protein